MISRKHSLFQSPRRWQCGAFSESPHRLHCHGPAAYMGSAFEAQGNVSSQQQLKEGEVMF